MPSGLLESGFNGVKRIQRDVDGQSGSGTGLNEHQHA